MFQPFDKRETDGTTPYAINQKTLAFKDRELEQDFCRNYFQNNLQFGRLCHLLAIFFYVVVGLWDGIITDPSRLTVWLWVICFVSVMFLGGLALSYLALDFYARSWRQVFAFYVLITGTGLTAVTVISGPNYPVYNFVGIIFCLLFCYTFIRLTFVWAVAAGNAIVLIYTLSAALLAAPPPQLLLSDFFYMMGINILGMAICYFQELMSRRDFILNEMLKQEQARTEKMNTYLEQTVRERTRDLEQTNQDLNTAVQRKKELVLQLKTEEARLQVSLDALEKAESLARLGYFEQNWQSGKIHWSKGLFRILGLEKPASPLHHDDFMQYVHADDRERVATQIRNAIAGQKSIDIEFRLLRDGGNTLVIHETADTLYDKNGHPYLTRGIFQDITDQKKARDSLDLLENQLIQAQKMESIGSLAGGIAHDFNNLLFPIVGLSEMMLDDFPPGSPDHNNLREIFNAGKRGRELVQQILSFSRQSERHHIPVHIQQILKEVIKLCRATIPADIAIKKDIQANCGPVMADPTQIHQIAMNLITNAYHAVENTGGTIDIQLKKISLKPEEPSGNDLVPGPYAALTVTDTGCGIPPDILNKIFDPYFTTKEKGRGTGLGLSTVYGIVKSHGGDIKVHSEVGKGTSFHVYLPVMEKSAGAAAEKQQQPLPTGTENILLVDDEAPIVHMEKMMLERLGYHITSFTSSVDALAAFKTDPSGFDLVITDMNMPKTNGMQLAQQLTAVRSDIPVIISTGFSERISREKADTLGIKGFLMKPVARSEMAEIVRKVLDEKTQRPVSL